MRDAIQCALSELQDNPEIVVVDAGLVVPTRTRDFSLSRPDAFVNVGVAEQSAVAFAGGVASTGKTVIVTGFSIFSFGRGWEQIRNIICRGNLNVKFVLTHVGLSAGEDGSSHQMLEDIAISRAIPNLQVLSPSDYFSAVKCIIHAIEIDGPVYVRLARASTPDLYTYSSFEMTPFTNLRPAVGKSVIVTTGYMTHIAIQAADILSSRNIVVGVLDLRKLNPVCDKSILATLERFSFVFCVEDHQLQGGIFSIMSEVLADVPSASVFPIGVDSRFGASGSPAELLHDFDLDAASLARRIEETISRQN